MGLLFYAVFLFIRIRLHYVVLHSSKAATHSNPPAQPRTLGSTISASCGQLLHASSLLRSSSAWAARRLVQVAAKDLGEGEQGGSVGDRRAQGTGVVSSTRRQPWMVPVVSMVTGRHLSAHKSKAWSKMAQEEKR